VATRRVGCVTQRWRVVPVGVRYDAGGQLVLVKGGTRGRGVCRAARQCYQREQQAASVWPVAGRTHDKTLTANRRRRTAAGGGASAVPPLRTRRPQRSPTGRPHSGGETPTGVGTSAWCDHHRA